MTSKRKLRRLRRLFNRGLRSVSLLRCDDGLEWKRVHGVFHRALTALADRRFHRFMPAPDELYPGVLIAPKLDAEWEGAE